MPEYPTLIRPPPLDPSKSAIENVLELTPLSALGPDIFTNTQPLWHPAGARGIFGGAVIAQCLNAAQKTVPAQFAIHSMHCYFVLAGDSRIPVVYHVEHVREGRSFATRTVQARQHGKCIFTATMSFMREGSGGHEVVEHTIPMADVKTPDPKKRTNPVLDETDSPVQTHLLQSMNVPSLDPRKRRMRQWIKARGTISPSGGHEAHLSALAYMSDLYLLGTVPRMHKQRTSHNSTEQAQGGRELDRQTKLEHFKQETLEGGREVGMMVSLDHTIYFHNPKGFHADEWLFAEMESPWAGDGRGFVVSRTFTSQGTLIATCFQEGIVRLKQGSDPSKSKL